MAMLTQSTRCQLARREVLAFEVPVGHTVVCLEGELWLTQDGQGDHLLRAGERWRVPDRGTLVVSALQAARFCVEQPVAAPTVQWAQGEPWRLGRAFPPLALLPSVLLR